MIENRTNETSLEDGLEIVTEKAVEIKKQEFFKMLAKSEKGLDLTIERLGNTYISKFKNDKGVKPSGFFIDYSFTYNKTDYQVGITYNVGVPIEEETFILTSGMNIFKILAVATDLTKADKIKVTKQFLENKLTGLKFNAEIGTSYNGGLLIEPVKKLE